MKDALLLLTPSNLRVGTKLVAQGGVLGWNVQKSVVPAKNEVEILSCTQPFL